MRSGAGDRVDGAAFPSTPEIGRKAAAHAVFGGHPRCSPPYCWYDDLSYTKDERRAGAGTVDQ
jgi:hypothetical protein